MCGCVVVSFVWEFWLTDFLGNVRLHAHDCKQVSVSYFLCVSNAKKKKKSFCTFQHNSAIADINLQIFPGYLFYFFFNFFHMHVCVPCGNNNSSVSTTIVCRLCFPQWMSLFFTVCYFYFGILPAPDIVFPAIVFF